MPGPILRVFAGPNGSGKTTIIKAVQQHSENNKQLNLGFYINADDIARDLKANTFSISSSKIVFSKKNLVDFARNTGLLEGVFTEQVFLKSFSYSNNKLHLKEPEHVEWLAQILARFLREQMLATKQTFSFETVFSHPSNIEIMRRAVAAGYKVYLYFVATESPEINKYRVQLRVKQHGHDVPTDKIESRYYRALELMYEAAGICYQSYFFDNSTDQFRLVAHFKNQEAKMILPARQLPKWFKKYYSQKSKNK